MTSPDRSIRPAEPPRSMQRRARTALLCAALAGLLLAAAGCASDGDGARLPTDPAARAAEIERLEARVERDRAALSDMVTTARDLEREPFHDDTELRAIAERLTADTDRLERLRAMPRTGAEEG